MEKLTTQQILDRIRGWIEEGKNISASVWIEQGEQLNTLISYEHDKLVALESEVAVLMNVALESQDKKNVAAAEIKVKADPKYAELRRQELLIKRIDRAITLADHHARIVSFS